MDQNQSWDKPKGHRQTETSIATVADLINALSKLPMNTKVVVGDEFLPRPVFQPLELEEDGVLWL